MTSHQTLLVAASAASQQPVPVVQDLLLQLGGEGSLSDSRRFYSTLNNDCSPLQLCHSLDDQGLQRLKLIVDPYSELEPGSQRLHCAVSGLKALLLNRDLPETYRNALSLFLSAFLPSSQHHKGSYFWLASDILGKGLAVYFSPRHLPMEKQWRTVIRCMSELGFEDCSWLSELELQGASLASIALQCAGDNVEVKIYWRLNSKQTLEQQPSKLFSHPKMKLPLKIIYPDRGVSGQGLLFSQSFSLANHQLTGVKIDICGHCLAFDTQQWLHTLSLLNLFLKTDIDLFDVFFDAELSIAFVSIGVTQDGKSRCNLYWKSN